LMLHLLPATYWLLMEDDHLTYKFSTISAVNALINQTLSFQCAIMRAYED